MLQRAAADEFLLLQAGSEPNMQLLDVEINVS